MYDWNIQRFLDLDFPWVDGFEGMEMLSGGSRGDGDRGVGYPGISFHGRSSSVIFTHVNLDRTEPIQ